jgi:polyisoprenyl-phosphate glycosyltransferase
MPQLSIIVPCYNEEPVLAELFQRLAVAASHCTADYEVVCVDDGSKDRTWQLLRTQHEADGRWRIISFARNFGHQAAVSAGLWYCTGDAVIIIDADLQHPPEEIRRMYDKWREGYQVVCAVRTKRHDPPVKRLLAWAFHRVLSILASFPIPNDAGDFCLVDRLDVGRFAPVEVAVFLKKSLKYHSGQEALPMH